MTNWHALPYELKCLILNYHIELFLLSIVEDFIKLHTKYSHQLYSSQGQRRPVLRTDPSVLRTYSLGALLVVAPELRQNALRIVANQLPLLCDMAYGGFKHEMSLLEIHFDDSSIQHFSKGAQKLLLREVMRELPRWQRDESGRLRSVDL